MPKFVQLVTETGVSTSEDYSDVAWVPELGFWHELKPSQRAAAKAINDFLLKRRGSLRTVPIKERSLQIFGDEKRLDALRIGDALFSGRLPLAVLGAFQVPFPLPYRQADAVGKPVLVVENHNSFWSFGEWNHHVRRYAAVVYGAGEAFLSTAGALAQVLREVGGHGVLYLGDLDTKGLRIPADFNRSVREGSPKVFPALDWYSWLLARGRRRKKPECAAGSRAEADAWLGPELGVLVHALWQAEEWIPQESLGFEELEESQRG